MKQFWKFSGIKAGWSLLKYVPHAPYMPFAPSWLTCLRAFVSYQPLCFTCLHTFRALPTCLIYVPFAPFSRALHALFVRVKIFLGCIYSTAETFHFPWTIKGTKPCCFYVVKKQTWSFLCGKIFYVYLRREFNSMFLCFSFHLFKYEVIIFFSLKW